MEIFSYADILLPREEDAEKWAVIACDQFSAQPDYWRQVRRHVGGSPSALHMILPEAELGEDEDGQIGRIHAAMRRALDGGLLRSYRDAFVYVERRLLDGKVRSGLVGRLDLEQYDYGDAAAAPVRATEKTVVERLPARMRIREGAALELPHVLLLCDDGEEQGIELLRRQKAALPRLYDFELMAGGGHVTGWLVEGLVARKLRERLARYEQSARARYARQGLAPLLYAVGDGNHSLAAAKACWEKLKRGLTEAERETHPARFALVELENLRDDAQRFEPIHRIVRHTDVQALLAAAKAELCAPGGRALRWVSGGESGALSLDPALTGLPVGALQRFLDRYLAENAGELDYIHGDEALCALAREPGAIGFLLPAMDKAELFPGIAAGGVLPRKTFSMGHAEEKRYYLEARKLR